MVSCSALTIVVWLLIRFFIGFGCDDRVTNSLILQGSVREYLQPFVIHSATIRSLLALLVMLHMVKSRHLSASIIHGTRLKLGAISTFLVSTPNSPNLSIVFMKIGDGVPFLIAYSSCILQLMKKCLIGCLSFMSSRFATIVVFSSLISASVGNPASQSASLLCCGSNVLSAGFVAVP
jgi:hypothetical protein